MVPAPAALASAAAASRATLRAISAGSLSSRRQAAERPAHTKIHLSNRRRSRPAASATTVACRSKSRNPACRHLPVFEARVAMNFVLVEILTKRNAALAWHQGRPTMKKPASMASDLIAAFVGVAWLVAAGPVQAQEVVKIAAGRAAHRPARQAGPGGGERGQARGRGVERQGRRARQADRGARRRRSGQPAGRRGRGREGRRRPGGDGRDLGHHQRHLHSGLRDPREGQPGDDQPRVHQPAGHRSGPEVGQPPVRARRPPGPGRHRVRGRRAEGEEGRGVRRRHHGAARASPTRSRRRARSSASRSSAT